MATFLTGSALAARTAWRGDLNTMISVANCSPSMAMVGSLGALHCRQWVGAPPLPGPSTCNWGPRRVQAALRAQQTAQPDRLAACQAQVGASTGLRPQELLEASVWPRWLCSALLLELDAHSLPVALMPAVAPLPAPPLLNTTPALRPCRRRSCCRRPLKGRSRTPPPLWSSSFIACG